MDHPGLSQQDYAGLSGLESRIVRPDDRIARQGQDHFSGIFHTAWHHGVWVYQTRLHVLQRPLTCWVALTALGRPHWYDLPALLAQSGNASAESKQDNRDKPELPTAIAAGPSSPALPRGVDFLHLLFDSGSDLNDASERHRRASYRCSAGSSSC